MTTPAPQAGTTPVIEVEHLFTRFDTHWVHRDLNLVIDKGEVMALVGGSGSGKTTLLRQMIGLLRPTQGQIRLFGEPLFTGDPVQERNLRRRFGMLFQYGALYSAFNVFQNIAFPLRELGVVDEALVHDLVMLKLSMVELLPRHASKCERDDIVRVRRECFKQLLHALSREIRLIRNGVKDAVQRGLLCENRFGCDGDTGADAAFRVGIDRNRNAAFMREQLNLRLFRTGHADARRKRHLRKEPQRPRDHRFPVDRV